MFFSSNKAVKALCVDHMISEVDKVEVEKNTKKLDITRFRVKTATNRHGCYLCH